MTYPVIPPNLNSRMKITTTRPFRLKLVQTEVLSLTKQKTGSIFKEKMLIKLSLTFIQVTKMIHSLINAVVSFKTYSYLISSSDIKFSLT